MVLDSKVVSSGISVVSDSVVSVVSVPSVVLASNVVSGSVADDSVLPVDSVVVAEVKNLDLKVT